jgi:hypothetical protein
MGLPLLRPFVTSLFPARRTLPNLPHHHYTTTMPVERQRKPCKKPGPYGPCNCITQKDQPATSAITTTSQRKNLTLRDWMTVFSYIDLHPGIEQGKVVKHFATKADGALIFNQSTLSRKLKMRSELKDRVHSNPNALSSKQPRIVTRPDVEKALILWFQGMEKKGKTVSGPMLQTKRQVFEERLGFQMTSVCQGMDGLHPFAEHMALLSIAE